MALPLSRGYIRPMPFKSKAQWRWAFANKKGFSRKWAHQTTGTTAEGTKKGRRAFGKLPGHKRRSSKKKS